MPRFLRRLTWVEFRTVEDNDAYHRLVCGIRGVPPDVGPAPSSDPEPYRSMARPADQFVHRRELDAVRELLVDSGSWTSPA